MRHGHGDVGHDSTIIASTVLLRELGHVLYVDPAPLDRSVVVQHRHWDRTLGQIVASSSPRNMIGPIRQVLHIIVVPARSQQEPWDREIACCTLDQNALWQYMSIRRNPGRSVRI